MNAKPDTSGIDRRWKTGEDDRCEVHLRSAVKAKQVDKVLDALWQTIVSRRRTKIVGIGVFEWKPWRRRIPTGRMVETWRLAFKPSRYIEKYKGDR